MKSVPNENILKLRELASKIEKEENDDYKVIVKKLKDIVESGKNEIETKQTPQSKIKCYENMCSTITSLLTSVVLM